jgi:hypothetical protein
MKSVYHFDGPVQCIQQGKDDLSNSDEVASTTLSKRLLGKQSSAQISGVKKNHPTRSYQMAF